jgi:hypothetical protein
MADAAYLILIAGAFGALVGLVRVCERIVRSAPVDLADSTGVGGGDGR